MVNNQDSPLSPKTLPPSWLLPVKNNINTPPANPSKGDRYRVTAVATGLWTGKENTIAIWDADNLRWFFTPLIEAQTWYDMTSQNWHYMSNSGVITQFDKIPLAESDVTGLVADLAGKASIIHKANHVVGGSDPFIAGDLLDATAKLNFLLGGLSVATRRGLNVIAGANIALTLVDNPANERTDLTITSSAGGTHPLLDGNIDTDTIVQAPVRGMLILGNVTPKWAGLALGSAGEYLRSNGTDLVYANIVESDVTNLVADLASKQNVIGYTPENLANKGAVNGYAPLDVNQLVPIANISDKSGWKEIGRVTLGAAAAAMSFTGLPNLGQFKIIFYALGFTASGKVAFQINADATTAHYNSDSFYNGGNNSVYTGTAPVIPSLLGLGVTSSESGEVLIINRTTEKKHVRGKAFFDVGYVVEFGGVYTDITVPISRIDLLATQNGDTTFTTFLAGSYAILYGRA